jgi:MerR family transcriptional regulator/heat shock protein HspR
MKIKRKKGYFSISAVAHMFDIHQQTIRLYERQGLICPTRSEGNTRMFSEDDIKRLEEIIYLTHELGINIAGVEIILKLKKQIKKLQKDMNSAFNATQEELNHYAHKAQEVVQKNVHQLVALQRNTPAVKNPQIQVDKEAIHNDRSNHNSHIWKIDYDE